MPSKHILWILYVGNLLNYMDRYILASLLDDLRAPPLLLDDTQLGWLMTGFLIVYMVAAPVVGWVGHKKPPARVLACAMVVWSAATCASAFADSFWVLCVLRAFVGVGEAAFATLTPVLIERCTPQASRGRALGLFFIAIPVGAALGYMCGGVWSSLWGWRSALALAGVPGMVLALYVWRMPYPLLGDRAQGVSFWGTLKTLAQQRTYVLWVCFYTAYTFALGGLAYWSPTFLKRVHGWEQAYATTFFGAVTVCTGIAGTWAGVRVLEWFQIRTRHAYACLALGCMGVAVPSVLCVLFAHGYVWVMLGVVCVQMALFVFTTPVNQALLSSVGDGFKTVALSVSTFCIHALGDVPSPVLIGWMSDAFALQKAMLCIPLALVLACVPVVWMFKSKNSGT